MQDVALLVGIEQYQSSSAPQLQGPALDAMRFALWLHQAQGMSAARMIMLVNKSDRWQGAENDKYEEVRTKLLGQGVDFRSDCSRRAIEKAWLEDLRKFQENGTLWVYWSGHGVTFPESREALLCADLDAGEPTFIYLNELRGSLRSKTFSHFREQRLIVDACSDYISPVNLGILRFRNPDTWQITEVPNQIELNAVAVGRRAKANRGSGFFSRLLLEELKSGWPSDLAKFHMKLKERILAEPDADNLQPRLRTLSPYFDPQYASTLELTNSPVLKAQFRVKDGEIDRFGEGRINSIAMELWVENASPLTRKVFFEIPDRTVTDRKWKKKRGNEQREFLTQKGLNAWGNLPIWARGRMKSGQDWTIRSTLYDALKQHYGTGKQSSDIQKALVQIRDY